MLSRDLGINKGDSIIRYIGTDDFFINFKLKYDLIPGTVDKFMTLDK